MPAFEKNEKLIYDTKANIEYIKNDWTDSLGQQYVMWLEETLQKLISIERKREIVGLKAQKIMLLCDTTDKADSEERQKVLKLERKFR